jgi:hypothetical protein
MANETQEQRKSRSGNPVSFALNPDISGGGTLLTPQNDKSEMDIP